MKYRADPNGLCRHCSADRVDQGQPETGLCAHCLDLAVWGAECFNCGRIPNRKPCDD